MPIFFHLKQCFGTFYYQRKNICCAHENNESQISDEREHVGHTLSKAKSELLLDRITETLKAPNPWICMALSTKITLEIKYNFLAVGLHSANYHQEDLIIKKEVWQIK